MDRHNYPDLQVRDAVRRSMSIPVFYTPIQVIDDDGLTHVLVDGGCTNNYPLNYFDHLYSPDEAFSKTIGFDLESGGVYNPNEYHDQTVEINNIIDLVTTLINTTIEVIERTRLTPQDKYRSIQINTEDYKSTDFNMKKKDIQLLAENGYKATIEFFDNL
jgi:predicted acylesterase/phospholipase RssA